MNNGKAFEYFVYGILLNSGFTSVQSDKLYIYDGSAGQMINGLGHAHNADVLLEPIVQTPFYFPSRLLVECKMYSTPLGLPFVRGVLGLRTDINGFEVIDANVLRNRQNNKKNSLYNYKRYNYQVALASFSGFTKPAQDFAIVHKIPLIDFSKFPFSTHLNFLITKLDEENILNNKIFKYPLMASDYSNQYVYDFIELVNKLQKNTAIAITNSGNIIFLFDVDYNYDVSFDETEFKLFWSNETGLWELKNGERNYKFYLPKEIMDEWVKSSFDLQELRKNAINIKRTDLSRLTVYYIQDYRYRVKVLEISKDQLKNAFDQLK